MSSLSDRIAAALTGSPSSGEIAALIAEAAQAAVGLKADRERAERDALDPRLSEDAVDRARTDMERAAFADRRLATGLEALNGGLAKARRREDEARRRQTYAEALEARDAAAAALRERYPVLAGELAALMRQVVDADRIVAAANANLPAEQAWIEPPEMVARGVAPNGMHRGSMIGSIPQSVVLPSLDPEAQAHGRHVWSASLI
ncbi:hypothetical protein OPKNFCMD_5471 [Methylobacterium crusticola]|uniref:ATPase n=1 Tax=Methylobacterium crusticola TaxID=1697972 RepID=A0ABQ4R710_9HYPH|nr:hypothetical protein [Methylobacterium crusticola]GJD52705.1 hypothetical protein OPKNFCMD_5471 [Methylobacterium crusticola]